MEQEQVQWNNAARLELRRLVSHAQPPGDEPLAAFGPWAEYIRPLREAHPRGIRAVRDLFVALDRLDPALGRLLSSDPEPEKEIWTTAEVLDVKLPPQVWIVPDILPEGLAFLAGRPKVGKSWLALQIAKAAGSGGRVFDRPVKDFKVLYLALEDGLRRLQRRLRLIDMPHDCHVSYAVEWPQLQRGGLDKLKAAIDQAGYQLVVIDTLSRVLGRADQLDLGEMNDILGAVHDLTRLMGVSVLLIDHHRKSTGLAELDPVDDLLGSTGKSATADVTMGLYRKRKQPEGTLKVTGRDVLDADLALLWRGEPLCWQVMGEAGQGHQATFQAAVLAAIDELTALGEVASTTNIAQHLDYDKGNVSRELAEMLRHGRVVRGPKQGRVVPYRLSPEAGAPPPEDTPGDS